MYEDWRFEWAMGLDGLWSVAIWCYHTPHRREWHGVRELVEYSY